VAWLYLAEEPGALGAAPGEAPAIGATAAVTGAEAHHASTVARVREGEVIEIADGRGTAVRGPVVRSARDRVEVRVEFVRREPEASPRIELVQALAKGGRDEMAIQAATELGVQGVVPWQAARSVSRWNAAKADKGRERWAAIVREAAKQSLRASVPTVEPLADLAALEALAAGGEALVVVLEPDADRTLVEACAPDGPIRGARRVLLVVGPEGGVAEHELERLVAVGALPVRLGTPVLRTSTAGPAALAALGALLGRWDG